MQITEGFYLVTAFVGVYLSMVWLIVYLQNRNKLFERPRNSATPSVTFIVPAYNEEKHIGNCLKSILNIDYPKDKLKIIVVDDGSTDRTAEIAKEFKEVRVIKKKNEGSKASAMNFGMKYVDTELVACMDADSFATRDYLKKVTSYFVDEKIGAVTASVKTNNLKTLLGKIQWVEYLMSVVFRKLFALLDCQFVVPGPGGIYRARVLKQVGDFETDTLTEDMEMALRLQINGYKLANCLDAYVYTACPEDFKTLFKQRMRWYRGYLENFAKYFQMFLNPVYGNFGMFFLPSTIIWIAIVVMLFAAQVGSLVFDSVRSLVYWSLINYEIILPSLNFSLYRIDSVFLSLTAASIVGLTLSVIGIRTGGNDGVKGRKFFYILYILTYPILFAFFWFCAVMMHMLRVRGRWR
jgi:cellulose synthase/poly-beta-1,6-N-acetylglucosamine synthase-like glycosyltransferase